MGLLPAVWRASSCDDRLSCSDAITPLHGSLIRPGNFQDDSSQFRIRFCSFHLRERLAVSRADLHCCQPLDLLPKTIIDNNWNDPQTFTMSPFHESRYLLFENKLGGKRMS